MTIRMIDQQSDGKRGMVAIKCSNEKSWNVVLASWHVVSRKEGSYTVEEEGDGLEWYEWQGLYLGRMEGDLQPRMIWVTRINACSSYSAIMDEGADDGSNQGYNDTHWLYLLHSYSIQLVISYLQDNHPHYHSLLFDFSIIKLESTRYWKVDRIISSCVQEMDHVVGFSLGANVRNWDCIAEMNNRQNIQEQWLLYRADGWWDRHLVSLMHWFVHGCFVAERNIPMRTMHIQTILMLSSHRSHASTIPFFDC